MPKTSDGFKRGDRVVRQFPGQDARDGRVISVTGDEIVVEWSGLGFPQVLPLDQRRYVKIAPS